MKLMKKLLLAGLVFALCLCVLVACGESADNELNTTGYTFNHRITRDNLMGNGYKTLEFYDLDSNVTFFQNYFGTNVNGYEGKFLVAEREVPEGEEEYVTGENGYECKDIVLVAFCCCESDAKAILKDFTTVTEENNYVQKVESFLKLNPSKTVYGVVGSVFYIGTKEGIETTQITPEN